MHRLLPVLLLPLMLAGASRAQSRMLATFDLPFPASSGTVHNPTDGPASVWSELVQVPGAESLRLNLGRVLLDDPADAVVIHNPTDGETQRLDQAALGRWRHRSAWFNGPILIVSLDLGPRSTGSVELAGVTGIGAPPGVDDLCGVDDRVASSDNRVFRLLLTNPSGTTVCTGFLVTPGAVFLSAGHCFSSGNLSAAVAEFNVPLSSAIGTLVHPPVADQFPVDLTSVQFQDAGIGNDWTVGRLHPNVNGANAAVTFGFFAQMATSWLGTISNSTRVTGYGADTSSPLMFSHHIQQTATGTHIGLNLDLTTSLAYVVDTDGGSSGSPIIQDGVGRVAGIHTNGNCASSNANQGTGIQNVQLQAALAAAGGCAGMNLNNGPILVSCSPSAWFGSPVAGAWNIAGVSGPGDWNIARENTSSSTAGSVCDFLLADGNLGIVPPASGLVTFASGSGTARADFDSAQVLSLDQTTTVNWTNTKILELSEFSIATPTSLTVTVSGDPALRWHLYAPSAVLGAAWRPRGQGLVASGQVGAAPATGITIATAGTFAFVVFRDGGPGIPNPTQLSVSLCTANGAPVVLSPNTPTTLPSGATPVCVPFTVTPATGTFNAVGLAAAADTSLGLAQAVSASSGNATEFVLAFQNSIAAVPLTGSASVAGASPPAAIEHVTSSVVPGGTAISTDVAAGHVLRLLSLSTVNSGAYDLIVTGDPSLRWYLFNQGTTDVWRGRSAAFASGQVGGPSVVLSLSAGSFALVVARDNGVAATNLPFQARLALTTTHLTLSGPGTVASVVNASHQFTCTPPSNRWTALGILGSVNNSHTLAIGSAISGSGSSSTAFVVANGRLGTVAPTDGLVLRSGTLSHGSSGALHQANATIMAVGSPGAKSWASSDLIHIFEFAIPATANYDINVSGVAGLGWVLFEPGTDALWRPRSTNIATAPAGTPATGIALSPGFHAIVVARSSVSTSTGTVTCSVSTSVNPVPVVTAVVPATLPAGSPLTTVLLNGSGFSALTTATIDASTPLGIVGRTPTQLVVSIPGSILQAPGSHTITTTNPAPGGGTSGPAPFGVVAPRITTTSPNSIAPLPPGAPAVLVTLDGTDFLPGAVVHAGVATLPTTFISPTQLTALVAASVPDAQTPGGLALTVENAHFAQSNTVSVRVAPGGNNTGSVVRYPLDPFPSEPYVARLEGGIPGSLFSLLVDFGYPTPAVHWPDMTGDLVLRISTPAVLPLIDGFGLFSPANPAAVFVHDPNGSAPGGVFDLPGFVWPSAPLNLRLALQSVHLDPGAAYGFTLCWPRTEDL